MSAKIPELINEPTKVKADITLGGISYPNGDFVCMTCFRKTDFRARELSLPVFKKELTGKEKCCLCSKSLMKSFILKDIKK